MQQLEEHSVGPAEANFIGSVAGADMCYRLARNHIVFFADMLLAFKILQDHSQELDGDAIGIGHISIATKPFNGEQLKRRPAVGIIPLRAAVVAAGGKAAGLFEQRNLRGDGFRLLFRSKSRPQRIECGGKIIGRPRSRLKIVIVEKPRLRVPQIFINVRATLLRFPSPLAGF